MTVQFLMFLIWPYAFLKLVYLCVFFILVDGNFTSWSEWSGCSGSCGNGTKIRYRSCSHPAPANGGQDCVGDVLDSTECVGVYCPGMNVSLNAFLSVTWGPFLESPGKFSGPPKSHFKTHEVL